MEGLNTSNFFSNYILNPFSSDLKKTDKLKALVGSIFLGVFALGIPHVVAFRHKVTPQQEAYNKETAIFNGVYPQKGKYYQYEQHHALAELGNAEDLRYFLSVSPYHNVNAPEVHKGMTPLHLAVESGSLECVNTLLARDDIMPSLGLRNRKGKLPYDLAIDKGRTDIANAIMDRQWGKKPSQARLQGVEVHQVQVDSRQQNLLFSAVEGSNESWLRELLQSKNIDINQPNEDGWPPLHRAIINGSEAVSKLLLQDSRININKAGPVGYTPLHVAASEGKTSLVRALLLKKPNLKQTNDHSETPEDLALHYKHPECAELIKNAFLNKKVQN